MDPWESIAANSVNALAQLGLQFGATYTNNWLAHDDAEARLELAVRARQALPPAQPNLLLMVLITGVVVLAIAQR